MVVADVMDTNPVGVPYNASFRQAAELFVARETSDLVVVDGERFAGILSESDLLRGLIPDFESPTNSVAGVSLQEAADLFIKSGRFNSDRSIASLVRARPMFLAPDDSLLKAATVMAADHLQRMPVIEAGKVVGMLSRAKISWALLTQDAPAAGIAAAHSLPQVE
jgi:CBS domain-containing protein